MGLGNFYLKEIFYLILMNKKIRCYDIRILVKYLVYCVNVVQNYNLYLLVDKFFEVDIEWIILRLI